MCNCTKTLEADEQGLVKEYIAKHKATIKEIKFTSIGYPLIRKEDGSTTLGRATLSVLEVETNERKRPIKVDILHTYCPFCGVKYNND